MKQLAAALLFLLCTIESNAQAPCLAPVNNGTIASSEWQYQITLADPQRQLLHVRLTIAPTAPGLQVQLPVWNATYQVRDFAEHVNWLRASDANGKPVTVRKITKSRWFVPNATQIEYEITAVDSGPFGAELTTEHLFLNLAEILVYPVDAPRGVIQLSFAGVPSSWRFATPLNSRNDGFCAANYDQLVDAPIEAGNFHLLQFEAEGAKYSIAVHAEPDDYDAETIKNNLRKIVMAEVDWMQDRPFDRYLFIYHFPRGLGRGGMEHAYGTAIETSAARLNHDPISLASVSAHEFFHLWNVKRIRPQTLEPVDYTKENYTRALWFSEGLSNTVADIALARSGLIGETTYLARLAGQIRQLEVRSAHRTQSAEESSLDAWLEKYPYYRSPERSVSYYDKGQIIGVLLDLEIRRVSNGAKSLRDLFQYMNEKYAKQGTFFSDSEGVQEAAELVTGVKFNEFFQHYVSGVDEIPYNDFFRAVGLKLERTPVSTADAGFTASTNFGPTPVVVAVTPGSEAEKAGVRPGDSINYLNGQLPEANIDEQISSMQPGSLIKLKISNRNRAREVKIKLVSHEDVDFVFSELADVTPAQKSRRAAWIHGDSEPAAPKR